MVEANQTSLIKMSEARHFFSSRLKRYVNFTARFKALGMGVGAYIFLEINLEISKIENIKKSHFIFVYPIPTSQAHISVRLSATSDSFCQNESHIVYNKNNSEKHFSFILGISAQLAIFEFVKYTHGLIYH